jgi:hypothetical protein
MTYTRNPMHPTALYLSETWWSGSSLSEAPPLPSTEDFSDIERLRVILPETVVAPTGWAKVKTTRFGKIAIPNRTIYLSRADVSIKSISREDPKIDLWIDLHCRLYDLMHSDNPVRALSQDLARRIFAGEDLPPNGLVAAFEGERMTGISSLRQGVRGFELGWTGFPQKSDSIAVAQLISAVIAVAVSSGAAWLEVEVDDTDLPLTGALEYFEVEWQECFETYEQKVFSRNKM